MYQSLTTFAESVAVDWSILYLSSSACKLAIFPFACILSLLNFSSALALSSYRQHTCITVMYVSVHLYGLIFGIDLLLKFGHSGL